MNIARIKLAAAIFLLASLALPEYTCSKYVGPDGKVVSAVPEGAPPTSYRGIQERHYRLESFDMRDGGSWLALLVFLWPLPVLAYLWRGRAGRLKRLISMAEPLLAIGSAYAVWNFSSLGTRASGAYLALGADAVYLSVWVGQVVNLRRLVKPPAD
jgi:hypothetical protein